MVVAYINGKMLTWARQRANMDISALAKGNITIEKLTAWEAGKEKPSQTQALTLAEKLGISYAMLFMPQVPPPDNPQIRDLRTKSGKPLSNPSLAFREVLNDTLTRQEWMRDERIDEGLRGLRFVGKFSTKSDPDTVAQDMRRALQVSTETRAKCSNFEELLRYIVTAAESLGILVMRSALVGHDTHRKLDEREFRGFALSDPYAPVIFVNDADAKAAQVFTVSHELAHIWIGADGISDRRPDQADDSQNEIELFCDKVAAEFLAPAAEFNASWRAGNVLASARSAAAHFKVSTLVALRRAKDLRHISLDVFHKSVTSEYDRFREIERQKRDKPNDKPSGGNFWASFEIRNSASLNAAVVNSIVRNRTTFTDASTILGLSIGSTLRYLRRVGAK